MIETPSQPYFYLVTPCAFLTLSSKGPVFSSLQPLFGSRSHCDRFIAFNRYKIHQRYSQYGSLNNPLNEFQAISMNFSYVSPTIRQWKSSKLPETRSENYQEMQKDTECFVEYLRKTIESLKTRFIISSESAPLLSLLQFQCFPSKGKIRLWQ